MFKCIRILKVIDKFDIVLIMQYVKTINKMYINKMIDKEPVIGED